MLESMKRLFEVERMKGKTEGFEEGRMAGITEGEEKGRTEGKVEGLNEGDERRLILSIRSLMETLKLTTEEAMDALQVPLDKRAYYLEKLVN